MSAPDPLAQEVLRLQHELEETQQSLNAILSGHVDALVVNGRHGEQVFSLISADHPYRILLEGMSEGAMTLNHDGLVLFCNERFAKMLGQELQQVIGQSLSRWLGADDQAAFEVLMATAGTQTQRRQLVLQRHGQAGITVYVSVSQIAMPGQEDIYCVIATDMTEHQLLEDMAVAKKMAVQALASSKQLEQSLEDSIKAIAATVESRDQYTAGHMQRVSQLSLAIAKTLGLSDDEQHGIALASSIHDVGKIGVPLEILVKPKKLSNLEYLLVKEHVNMGHDILKNIAFPWPVAEMVFQHHERIDGSGYPRGLQGQDMLLGAKIIAVADVIEAMSMNRPYRFVLGQEAALAEITQGRGRLYDPEVVDACLRVFSQQAFTFDVT
jgi:PAS domain S-box-containing protein